MWATDANGDSIDINIINGSDLLINGRSVQGDQNIKDISTNKDNIAENKPNINDLGFGVAGATALSTAMTALPTVADDSPVSCGVGTGAYSNRYAMSVGCAFKTTERLSFNTGGSYVFGGAADYGKSSLSNVAGRAGFVFKLGEIQKPASENNEQLQSQLDEVKQINASLLARLEKLERLASGQLSLLVDRVSSD